MTTPRTPPSNRHWPDAYDSRYYDEVATSARSSAAVIVPLVINLIGLPNSVIDVGCGRGSWLAAFKSKGTSCVLGVDSPNITGALDISSDTFVPHDLETRIDLQTRFDLAISLEVIEHLPQSCEAFFVADLTKLSDVVLFSGAIPGQGGEQHINEQWQEHWVKLFAAHDYQPVDCLRPLIWDNPLVEWWYAQNIILYAKLTEANQKLRALYRQTRGRPLNLVHPENYLRFADRQTVKAMSRIPR